jgi:hypothetical protein
MHKHYLPILAVAFAGTLALGAAYGADIYNSSGFENPPFVAGQTLVGQDGWTGVPPLSIGAAIVSTSLPYTGLQSVEVRGADLVQQDFIHEATHGYYDAIGSYRRPVSFDVGANRIAVARVEAAVRVDGPGTPGKNFFSASIGAIAAIVDADGTPDADGIGELAISSDGFVHGYCGCQLVPTFQASAPITLGTWHILAVEVNFVSRTYMFFVDGRLLGVPFPFPADVNTNTLLRGSVLAYAAPDTTTLHKSNYAAHYDNFAITTPGITTR